MGYNDNVLEWRWRPAPEITVCICALIVLFSSQLCDAGHLLNLCNVAVSSSINKDKDKTLQSALESTLVLHVKQFESCFAKLKTNSSSLFMAIVVFTRLLLSICHSRTMCDPHLTLAKSARPWGPHGPLLWCTTYFPVVGWGGRVIFVHQSFVGITVAS